MLDDMRNPIQPSPDRPIPLPDCILMDGWWADRDDGMRERPDSTLRLVAGEGEKRGVGQRDENRH
jgi:hypothetical protein